MGREVPPFLAQGPFPGTDSPFLVQAPLPGPGPLSLPPGPLQPYCCAALDDGQDRGPQPAARSKKVTLKSYFLSSTCGSKQSQENPAELAAGVEHRRAVRPHLPAPSRFCLLPTQPAPCFGARMTISMGPFHLSPPDSTQGLSPTQPQPVWATSTFSPQACLQAPCVPRL